MGGESVRGRRDIPVQSAAHHEGTAAHAGSHWRSSGRVSRARAGIGVRRDSGPHKYRLRVPPNVPVEQYWSVTAYDRETHARIREMECASGASNLPTQPSFRTTTTARWTSGLGRGLPWVRSRTGYPLIPIGTLSSCFGSTLQPAPFREEVEIAGRRQSRLSQIA